MEFLIEIAFYLLLELLFPMLGEIAAEVGLRAIGGATSKRQKRHPVLIVLGCFLLGALVGGLSLWLAPARLSNPGALRGASLVISPLVIGCLMSFWGAHRRAAGHETTGVATFHGGAALAFGTAVVRFLGIS